MSTTEPSSDPPVEILIAEDSPTQTQRLKHILAQQGYGVSIAANGRLALEATQRRKPALGAKAPDALRLSVPDSGIGIAPDKLETVLNSFTQVDSSITRRYGGIGLGLAICKRLVELMNGRI